MYLIKHVSKGKDWGSESGQGQQEVRTVEALPAPCASGKDTVGEESEVTNARINRKAAGEGQEKG
tara:strand:- start:279 stop:473 length:195 start_codon:yes stop_codon:yes gene_type:complete